MSGEWRTYKPLMPGYTLSPTKQDYIYTNVKNFGATGDGVTDDVKAIQAAIDAAADDADTRVVWFPPGTYLVKGNIVVKDGTVLRGIRGESVISVDSTFVRGGASGTFPYYGVIYNEHSYSAGNVVLYNESTADSIEIRDISFTMTDAGTNKYYAMGIFSNCKKLILDNTECRYTGTAQSVHNFTVYAACQNVQITNNYWSDLYQAEFTEVGGVHLIGSPLLVKNQQDLGDSCDATSISENIYIAGNTFVTNRSDEILALYSQDAPIRNVQIVGNVLRHYKPATYGYHSVNSVTIYARMNTSYTTAELRDVTFIGNSILIDELATCALMLGQSADSTHVCENIIAANNNIRVSALATATTPTGIRAVSNTYTKNISVVGNHLVNDSASDMGYGIYGGEIAADNILDGGFNVGIGYTRLARGNHLSDSAGANFGIAFVPMVHSNYINGHLVGVDAETTQDHHIEGNWINLANSANARGIRSLSVATSAPVIYSHDNLVVGLHADCFALSKGSGTGAFYTCNDHLSGTGTFSTGTVTVE